MDKPAVTALHRRLLARLRDGSTDSCAAEARIDATCFTDPGILERERSRLFRQAPQPVAFSGEIPDPGCYLALEVLDTPVLLSRDEHGVLHAFINACAHRGARLAGGSGKVRALTCPFHGWTYQADGALRGRPGKAYFDSPPESAGLSPLPVSERHGLVVLGSNGQVSQDCVDEALNELGAELATYGFGQYRTLERRQLTVQANWKLVNDLSLESYHFATLHRDSVAEMLAANAVVDTYSRHSRWAFPLKSISRLNELDESEWPGSLEGSVTYTLYPGVMVLVNSLGAQMIRAEPGPSPDTTTITYVGMCAPGCDTEAALAAYRFGGDVFANEDLPAAEQCQRGIAARGGDYPLGRNEPLLQFWHRLWAEAID